MLLLTLCTQRHPTVLMLAFVMGVARFARLQIKPVVCRFLRYDWTIVSKVAQDFPLQQVIGGSMGCEYIDVFSSLLQKDMRHILTKILTVLGDMDLIR